MNILVYNIAAEYAGAMTILENFYHEVLKYNDKSINWYFLVSTDKLTEKENLKVIYVPWVKKSWFHRSYYDHFGVQKRIKEFNIDIVFSMQNMPVRHIQAKQIVYLHQSLQYSPIKFSLLNKSEREYAIRQKIICNIYKRNLKYSDLIIVQTNWIKEASASWIPFSKDKIKVVSPKINISDIYRQKKYELKDNIFFYPAGDGSHKNHKVIIEACKLLKKQGINNFKVIFTLDANSVEYSKKISNDILNYNLPIDLVGIISKEKVYEYYKYSVLIFPSYLETFGLPLEEAKQMKSIILTSDMPFSHEILDDYENAYFFNYSDSHQLYDLMRSVITKQIVYKDVKVKKLKKDASIIDCIVRND